MSDLETDQVSFSIKFFCDLAFDAHFFLQESETETFPQQRLTQMTAAEQLSRLLVAEKSPEFVLGPTPAQQKRIDPNSPTKTVLLFPMSIISSSYLELGFLVTSRLEGSTLRKSFLHFRNIILETL